MRSTFAIALLALAAQAQAQEAFRSRMDDASGPMVASVDKLMDGLFERSVHTLPSLHEDVEDTTLGKTNLVAPTRRAMVAVPAYKASPGLRALGNTAPAHFQGQLPWCKTTCAARDGFVYSGSCSPSSRPGTTIAWESGRRGLHSSMTAHAYRPSVTKTATVEAPAAAEKETYVRPFYKGVKQVTSLGPKTFPFEKIMELFKAGADIFRINLSHGAEDKVDVIAAVRKVEKEMGYPIGVLADLQGPKQRCGMFKDDLKFELKEGDKFRFDMSDEEGDTHRVKLPHPEILKVLKPGNELLIDDGKIRMTVQEAGGDWADCKVTVPGMMSSRKGVNTPDIVQPISAITPKDQKDLDFILNYEPDYVALSFVQVADDMKLLREKINAHPSKHKPKTIAKIEKPVAIDNLAAIVEASDAIMVARGDLGVEMDIAQVPMLQKQIVAEARKQGKPVIMATQMLESMMDQPSPTRAECSDVSTAVFDGVDAVMLSGETASGKFPKETVTMQRRLITNTENSPMFKDWERGYALTHQNEQMSDADSVVIAAKSLAENVKAKAIIVFTTSGTTAKRMSRLHTDVPILAITPSEATARQLALVNHVYPSVLSNAWDGSRQTFSVLVDEAIQIAKTKGLVKSDTDKMVITGGLPFGVEGVANIIRVVQAAGPDCWTK